MLRVSDGLFGIRFAAEAIGLHDPNLKLRGLAWFLDQLLAETALRVERFDELLRLG